MSRRSFRNFLTSLRAMQVEDGDLPRVSDDVQMIYQMDDFSMFTSSQYGSGGTLSGLAGHHMMMQLEVRSPFGVVIEYGTIVTQGGSAPLLNGWWTQETANTIVGAVTPLLAIQQGPPPESIFTAGTILSANVPTERFSIDGNRGDGIAGLFLRGRPEGGPSQFLAVFQGGAGSGNSFGLRWRELSRDRDRGRRV